MGNLTQEEIVYLKILLANEASKYSSAKIEFKPDPNMILKKLEKMGEIAPVFAEPLVDLDKLDATEETIKASNIEFMKNGKKLQSLTLLRNGQPQIDELTFLCDKEVTRRVKLIY